MFLYTIYLNRSYIPLFLLINYINNVPTNSIGLCNTVVICKIEIISNATIDCVAQLTPVVFAPLIVTQTPLTCKVNPVDPINHVIPSNPVNRCKPFALINPVCP